MMAKTIGRAVLFAMALISALLIWVAAEVNSAPRALSVPRNAPDSVLIDNVRLVSMRPGAPAAEDAMAVLVIDGAIAAIGPAGTLSAPDQATPLLDGRGATLLPGLIDAHVHVWDEAELAGYLAHGVTSVRNMSGMPFHLPLAQRIAAGRILGPDLVTTGPIINSPGPNQQANHVLVATADEARAEVRKQHDAGYRTLKLYSNLRREPFEAVMDEARRLGMSVTGHTPEGVRGDGVPYDEPFDIAFLDALASDFVTIEHVESVVWHGLRGALDEEGMAVLAREIASAGVTIDATLIAHDNLVRVAESEGAYLDRAGTDTINPILKRLEQGTYQYWSDPVRAAREKPRAQFHLLATRLLHEAGAPIIAGSDAGIFTNIPGSSLTRELELLVRAGLTPHEALEAATARSGPLLGFGAVGMIAPGYAANLILVDGDPLRDVSLVEHPATVILHGRVLTAERLALLRKGAAQTSSVRSAWRILRTLQAL